MKKLIINKTILLLALLVSVSACKDELDINESQVDATVDNVAPDLLLAGAITAPRGQFEVTTSELGSIMMNQWAGDVNNVTGGFLDEFRLNITQNFYTSVWQNLYRGMGTYQLMIEYEGEENFDNHRAIARILKSYYMQYIVDLYGDCPYSEALQFGSNFTPAYDDDQAIYRDLIVQLDAAIATLQTLDNPANPVGSEDIIFNGDLSSWVKLANTLKLRILLRQSELAGSDGETATYLNDQFASLQQNFLTTDAIINPPYENAVGKQNPFYGNYGQNTEGDDTFDNDFIVPSEYMAEFLKGNTTEDGFSTNVEDPRILRLFEPLPGTSGAANVVGVQQGATNTTAPPELSELGPGVLIGSDQVSYLFSAAESYFLQAEAAHRGWISGNAQALFNNGITASFNQLGIAGSAAAYITASQNTNRIGWAGSSNKIEAIMTQKWIAMCGAHNAVESWIDFTRTGYPNVPLSIVAEKPNRPNRLLYPASEYSTNSANVPNQPASDAFNTRIFWDVN